MLARQITADLQQIRNMIPPNGTSPLTSKGIDFGHLSRRADGSWDVSGVEGIAPASLGSKGPVDPPTLIIRPFHQAGRVVSIREFTNNAFNHHHGIQTTERFGKDTDPDGDGVTNEMSRAEVTATALFQATLPVPRQMMPQDESAKAAARLGEGRFRSVGCAACHIPALPLDHRGWIYSEPNPYNPVGNLRAGDAPPISVDLTSDNLPGPRLKTDDNGIVWVPAFTDLKLHDICAASDPNVEALNMQFPPGSDGFFGGSRRFLTKKLWGMASAPNHYHHGQYTTIREAVLAHAGEALDSKRMFAALPVPEQDAVIEYLKTFRVVVEGFDDPGAQGNQP